MLAQYVQCSLCAPSLLLGICKRAARTQFGIIHLIFFIAFNFSTRD